jgi:hypothetical protein
MTRHIADHPEPENAALRLRHFVRLAREEMPHPATRALHIRRPAAPAEGRLEPILRVLRDRSS